VTADLQSTSTRRPVSAAARAYRYTKERLLDGRFAAGTLLSENELARSLGISRTPVREAFLHLEAEELIELYPRRGALVKPITPSEADDVLEARLLIERHCVVRVAEGHGGLAPVLRGLVAEQERALTEGGEPFAVSDRAFHRMIVAANGNEVLTRQYDALRDRQQRIAAGLVARDPGAVAQFIAEHGQLATAIEQQDGARAADLIAVHLERAHALARSRANRPRSMVGAARARIR
jgi:DNA-binding GntR family transcriptional regulator